MQAGDLIAGRYRLAASVGAGAVGEVWRATDERLQITVAIKFLFDRRGDQVDRFRREATTLARLDHPSIVRAIDYDATHDPPFIVMSFVEGRTLSAEPRPATVARTRRLLTPVAEALVAAHAAGVAHRDLKPGNIMLGAGDRIFVTDFGLARADDEPGLTATEVRLGTPEYWSPEQARGFPAGPPADIYALATMAFELLAGRLPFPTPERGDRLAASYLRVSQNAPKLAEVAAAVAAAEPELADFVDRALGILPDERPTTVEALAAIGRGRTEKTPPRSEDVVATQRTVVTAPAERSAPPIAPTVSTAQPPVESSGSGRRLAIVGLAVVALGGGTVATINALSGGPGSTQTEPSTTAVGGTTDGAITDADRTYAGRVVAALAPLNDLQATVNDAMREVSSSGESVQPATNALNKGLSKALDALPSGETTAQSSLSELADNARSAHVTYYLDAAYLSISSDKVAGHAQEMADAYKALDDELKRFGIDDAPVLSAEQPAVDAVAAGLPRLQVTGTITG